MKILDIAVIIVVILTILAGVGIIILTGYTSQIIMTQGNFVPTGILTLFSWSVFTFLIALLIVLSILRWVFRNKDNIDSATDKIMKRL